MNAKFDINVTAMYDRINELLISQANIRLNF